jgi:hypothetical protein
MSRSARTEPIGSPVELRGDRLPVAGGPLRRLVELDVAVHDPQRDVVATGEVLRDPVGDGH